MKNINHKNCVKLIELLKNEDKFFIVQELMLGGDLYKYSVCKPEYFTKEVVAKILIQLLEGLNYLHGMNIVHRDIKLENVLLENKMTRDNLYPVVKIADFGLSSYLDPRLQGLNRFCGTPGYMAPEVLKHPKNPSTLDTRYRS